MPKYQQNDEQLSDGVNLLISILVRYPEIGTISFDPQNDNLKMTFLLSGIPSPQEFEAIRQLLSNSVYAYQMLEGVTGTIIDIQLSSYDKVAMLTIVRDVNTLSKGEIALVITLLREKLRERLITDHNESMQEEDLLLQEELIDNMLESMKQRQTVQSLIAIREDGRVLVFNK
ncbi:hypothetical protein [Propionispora sp. 2/2-37]|uniref:hypothetical protein n=1 Tax=Propionispora sp. 2/2-37 TaxID=1677858 RepID=UPI0006BB6BE4|nr:hypothetical protein [Propionispora sp. 2/2-37]